MASQFMSVRMMFTPLRSNCLASLLRHSSNAFRPADRRLWPHLGVWTASTPDPGVHLVGLVRERAERVLDVEAVKVTQNRRGLRIEWSGLVTSAADEMYHVRWANVEGTEIVDLEGMEVLELNANLDHSRPLSEEDWLAKVRIEVSPHI